MFDTKNKQSRWKELLTSCAGVRGVCGLNQKTSVNRLTRGPKDEDENFWASTANAFYHYRYNLSRANVNCLLVRTENFIEQWKFPRGVWTI